MTSALTAATSVFTPYVQRLAPAGGSEQDPEARVVKGVISMGTGLRGHARRLAAALVIVGLGLVGGLGLFEGPLHASSTVSTNGNQNLAAPPGGSAYQAYRIDERGESVSAGDAWQAYRASERDAFSVADPYQAWLSYRAGERASLP